MKAKDRHIRPEELSAYLDRDVDAELMEEVGRHLKACEMCRKVADELGVLCSRLSDLSDVEPERNLWASIEPKLNSWTAREKSPWWQRFWMTPVAAAAGAAAVLVVVLVLGRVGVNTDREPVGPIDALEAVAKAEIEYRRAIDSLEQTLMSGQKRMSPEIRKIVTHGLAEINQAIDKYRAELGRNPNDMETQESMLAVYQQKVDFMTDLVAETLAK